MIEITPWYTALFTVLLLSLGFCTGLICGALLSASCTDDQLDETPNDKAPSTGLGVPSR
jgi:hypothetical protein